MLLDRRTCAVAYSLGPLVVCLIVSLAWGPAIAGDATEYRTGWPSVAQGWAVGVHYLAAHCSAWLASLGARGVAVTDNSSAIWLRAPVVPDLPGSMVCLTFSDQVVRIAH